MAFTEEQRKQLEEIDKTIGRIHEGLDTGTDPTPDEDQMDTPDVQERQTRRTVAGETQEEKRETVRRAIGETEDPIDIHTLRQRLERVGDEVEEPIQATQLTDIFERDYELPEADYRDTSKQALDAIDTEASHITGYLDRRREQIQREEQQLLDRIEEYTGKPATGTIDAQLDLLEKRPEFGAVDQLEELREEFDIYEQHKKIGEQTERIAELVGDMRMLEAQEQEAMQKAEAMEGATLETIAARQSEIERDFTGQKMRLGAKIGAEEALYEAYNENFERSNVLLDQSLEAHVADYEMELERWQNFFDVNREMIQRLDAEEQQMMEFAYNALEREYENEREDHRDKLKLLQSAAEMGIDPGIRATELENYSLEEVYGKVGSKIRELPTERDWQIRRIGNDLYRVDATSGETQLIAEGQYATPQSYREWQLAGSPGSYGDWLAQESVPDPLSRSQLNRLSTQTDELSSVPQEIALEYARKLRRGETIQVEEGSKEHQWAIRVRDEMAGDYDTSEELDRFLRMIEGTE